MTPSVFRRRRETWKRVLIVGNSRHASHFLMKRYNRKEMMAWNHKQARVGAILASLMWFSSINHLPHLPLHSNYVDAERYKAADMATPQWHLKIGRERVQTARKHTQSGLCWSYEAVCQTRRAAGGCNESSQTTNLCAFPRRMRTKDKGITELVVSDIGYYTLRSQNR